MIKSQASFTLTELLVIIGVIGIIVLMGMPALKAYQPDLELSATARKLIIDLRYAQQLAVAEQIDHGIRFSSATNQYWVIRYGAVEEILASSILPEKVSFQEISGFTNDQAIFNPYGAAKESGTVTLINTKDATSTIDVRSSGFVRIIK